jgi:hypothetical protein
MTLSVVWFRNRRSMEELVFASDSRLSGGERWDGCPKIVELPRSDCLVSFAGDTHAAYPMILQLAQSIAAYPPSADRRLDVTHLSGHMSRLFNRMRDLVGPPFPSGQDEPDTPRTVFLFGGYSWRYRGFYAWKLSYANGAFRTDGVLRGRPDEAGWRFRFSGDKEAVDYATQALKERHRDAGNYPEFGLDMEPFEVLRDVIREQRFATVGGAPQLAKVYRHMNTRFFAVEWDGHLTVAGRPILSYERAFLPRLDPDRPEEQPRPPGQSSAILPGETDPTEDEIEPGSAEWGSIDDKTN